MPMKINIETTAACSVNAKILFGDSGHSGKQSQDS